MRHGGQILIAQLEAQGIDSIYCVPGISFLAALDGLYDSISIQTIVCRHPESASIMAGTHGKLTSTPGVCFTSGATALASASVGIEIARRDSLPMILFAGSSKPLNLPQSAKWVAKIPDAKSIPQYISRACTIALSGRKGPVVLGLPDHVLTAYANVELAKQVKTASPSPSETDITLIDATIRKASRPLIIIGGADWSEKISRQVKEFAQQFDLPVISAPTCHDYLDNSHPNYIGRIGPTMSPALIECITSSDVILALGLETNDFLGNGEPLLNTPNPRQFLIHIHPSAEELNAAYHAALPVQSSIAAFADQLESLDPQDNIPWRIFRRNTRIEYELDCEPQMSPGDIKLERVIKSLSDMLPRDAILTHGAGNHAAWINRYFQFKQYGTQLNTNSNAMGYALPAAITAKLRHPERPVIVVAGDGGFMASVHELATAIHYGLAIIIIVVNNRMYGTVRMHQERDYPDRILGTSLSNPDFAKLAESFGAFGALVERSRDFRDVFKKAVASGRPAIIELRTDREAISPRQTLSDVRNMEPTQQSTKV